MSTVTPVLTNGHQHRLPPRQTVDSILDHTDALFDPERVTDRDPVDLALATLIDACEPCQRLVSRELAARREPWTVLRLAGPVATDVRRVVRVLGHRGPIGLLGGIRCVLRVVFDNDVADVVTPLAAGRDLTPAVRCWQALDLRRRYRVVRAVLHGVAHPPPIPVLTRLARSRTARATST